MEQIERSTFFNEVRARLPQYFSHTCVLDVGRFDEYGNHRHLFDFCVFQDINLTAIENIDILTFINKFSFQENFFHTIILELNEKHNTNNLDLLNNLMRTLRPGGLLVFRFVSRDPRPVADLAETFSRSGFEAAHHGSPHLPSDTLEFFSPLQALEPFLMSDLGLDAETNAYQFWGIKQGPLDKALDVSWQVPNLHLSHNFVANIPHQAETTEAAIGQKGIHNQHQIAFQQRLIQTLKARVADYEAKILKLEEWKSRRLSIKVKALMRKVGYKITGRKAKARRNFIDQLAITNDPIHLTYSDKIYILSSAQTSFIALLMKDTFASIGMNAIIIDRMPKNGFSLAPYFVIAPQVFKNLPDRYISFQVEQSVSSRWFNDEYFDILKNSSAILDYSIQNLKYMQKNGLPVKQMFYVPLSPLPNLRNPENEDHQGVDVVFYGDPRCARRQKILSVLQQHFKLEVIFNVYDKELYNKLAKAKIVVNIHYYEGALLETTRIYECLSLGKIVVSEKSADQSSHSDLDGIIEFVDVGDVAQMAKVISKLLANPELRAQKQRNVQSFASAAPKRFQFYFLRFLLSQDAIGFDQFYEVAGNYVHLKSGHICLGLPEYMDRQAEFLEGNSFGFEMFDGLRHSLGWVGCGLSYKFIIKKALEQGYKRITICEDDVDFIKGWQVKYEGVLKFLDNSKDWDIFSGFIFDLRDDFSVLDVKEENNQEYVFLNKTISMVFNVYHKAFFQQILAWDPDNRETDSNAIDLFIKNKIGVRVITTSPFLVGHKVEPASTLWGVENASYSEVIAKSSKLLQAKVEQFKSEIGK